jgi:AraC family transcriptional regulator
VPVPPTTRLLLDTAAVQVGEFDCGPGHPLWDEVNDNIGSRPHVVFPRTSVYIGRGDGEQVLATPNHVLFYGSHELYRRGLHDPRGDRCVFVTVAPELWHDLAGPRLTVSHCTSDADTYLVQHLVVRELRDEHRHDLLCVEEALQTLVARAVARALEADRPQQGRPRTRSAHRDLVEEAKALLTERHTESLSLGEIACALHTSPFHLARVFHAWTGFTLHRYRIQLRLRRALERMLDPGTELTRLAFELGFSSLSHFSDSFRGAFGVPPSALRAGHAELSKIVEARLAAAS